MPSRRRYAMLSTDPHAQYMRQYTTNETARTRINARRRDRYSLNANLRETKKQNTKKQEVLRREILRWLKAQPCFDCGNRFNPECMDFDHRPDTTKAFNVGNLKTTNPEFLQEEITKCDLVCSNCHRTRTLTRMRGQHGLRQLPAA